MRAGCWSLLFISGCLSVPPASDSEGDATGATTNSLTSSTTSTATSSDASSGTSSGTSSSTTQAGSSGGPSNTTGGDGTLDVDGELIEVPPGWTGGVWFDFSDQYLFDANAYQDDRYVFNNAPQSMFILRTPFEPGLGVIAVHTVIELQDTGSYFERNFFQATGSTGPDALWQAVDCRGLDGLGDVYCFNAGSQGGGDGLFALNESWSMSLVDTINNMNYIGMDPQGIFSGSSEPTLYYGTPDGLYEYGGAQLLPGGTQPRKMTDDGKLAVIFNATGMQQLAMINPGSFDAEILRTELTPSEPIARQNSGALRIVTGETSDLPGVLYVLVQATELYEYDNDANGTMLARSAPGQTWRWASAVVPELDHPLTVEGRPRFFVLESNRDLDIDRVIWLQPPA